MGLQPERLTMLREQRGLTQVDLSELTGISIPTLSRIENGKSDPKTNELSKLAQALNVHEAFFFKDSEVMTSEQFYEWLKSNDDAPVSNLVPRNPQHNVTVRVLPKDFAGCCGWGTDWSWNTEGVAFEREYSFSDAELTRFSPLIGMYVIGDSMKPYIEDGDMVMFTNNPSDIEGASNGSIVVVKYEGRMIVRGLYNAPGKVILKAWNKNYEDIEITPDEDFRICGIVLRRSKEDVPPPMV